MSTAIMRAGFFAFLLILGCSGSGECEGGTSNSEIAVSERYLDSKKIDVTEGLSESDCLAICGADIKTFTGCSDFKELGYWTGEGYADSWSGGAPEPDPENDRKAIGMKYYSVTCSSTLPNECGRITKPF